MGFKIESGIELPKPCCGYVRSIRSNASKYQFDLMKPGDSFLVEIDFTTSTKNEINRLRCAVAAWQKRHPGVKFATRKVEGGLRCWRLS